MRDLGSSQRGDGEGKCGTNGESSTLACVRCRLVGSAEELRALSSVLCSDLGGLGGGRGLNWDGIVCTFS